MTFGENLNAAENLEQQIQNTPEPSDTPGSDDAESVEISGGAPEETEDDILDVHIGEKPENEDRQDDPFHGKEAPAWVKDLRKTNRELARQNRELQSQLKKNTPTESKPVALPPKPTLEALDYDSEKYEKELENWYELRRAYEAEKAKKQQSQLEQENAWKARLEAYNIQRTNIKAQDFDDAEHFAIENFTTEQQGIIIHGADNSALLVYALGKNQDKAKEIAKIKDPVKFAFAVAKIEKDLKVTKRQPSSSPEKPLKTHGKVSNTPDATLDRLRSEAEKTGNYSKVIAYKNQLKNQKG